MVCMTRGIQGRTGLRQPGSHRASATVRPKPLATADTSPRDHRRAIVTLDRRSLGEPDCAIGEGRTPWDGGGRFV